MSSHVFSPQINVRPIKQSDVSDILSLFTKWWRTHQRIFTEDFATKLKTQPGFLVEDNVGVRGVLVFEPQPGNFGLIIAVGLRDSWLADSLLDKLLPHVEADAQALKLNGLLQLGVDHWLYQTLQRHGFYAREWLLGFERRLKSLPPSITEPAHIRPATPPDQAAIMRLDALTFDEVWHNITINLRETLQMAPHEIQVAEVAKQVVGYVWCEQYTQRFHLTRIAVKPHHQGQGIGGQLLVYAMRQAQQKGATLMSLNTAEQNRRSQALYERFGFINTKQRMPVMWKPLNAA